MSDTHIRLVRHTITITAARRTAAVLLLAGALGAGEEELSINAPPPPAAPSLSGPISSRARPVASGSPATRPTRGGAAASAPGAPQITLPSAFATLNKRSIFARNGMASGAAARPVSPESTFGLRGIVFDDTSFVLFVEDTTSHRTLQLRPGDAVAGGKVGQISLDEFEYESGGTVKHVRLGQNLAGAPLPPVQAAAPAGPTSAPAEGMPAPGPAPGRGPARPVGPGGPVYEIGPNGQRVRDYVAERAG